MGRAGRDAAIVSAIFAVAVVVICAYHAMIRRGGRDWLARVYVRAPPLALDGWALSHVLLYTLLGRLFPGRYAAAVVCGVAWEVFEKCLGAAQCRSGKDVFWYGRYSDVLLNLFGYSVGSALAGRSLRG